MLTQAEIALIDKITVALQKWRGPRMRDQKIYHTGISCVLSSVEIIDMELIRGVTDENDSEILRRLIRGAAAKVRRNR